MTTGEGGKLSSQKKLYASMKQVKDLYDDNDDDNDNNENHKKTITIQLQARNEKKKWLESLYHY